VGLVHCNGQIITDELHSTIFVSQITTSVEVYESMPLSVLKQVILRLFVPNDGKSYVVDLCYRCPVYMTDIRNSYRYVKIMACHSFQRFELMAFIQ